MRHLTALIVGSVTASALAYVPTAPIQAMNRVVMLESRTGPFGDAAAPQLLMKNLPDEISRDSVPYFTLNSDNTIRLEGTGSCIEASNGKSGHPVRLNRCTGEPRQKWNWIPDSHGGNRIQLQDTEKCLDANVEGGLSGTPVVLWECESKGAGAWKFEETVPPKRGRYMLMNLITLVGVAALSLGALLRQYTKPRKLVPVSGGATSSVDEGGVFLSLPLAMQMASRPQSAADRADMSPERRPAILHPGTFAECVAKRNSLSGDSSQRSGNANMSAASSDTQGARDLPPGWKEVTDKESGKPYYWNSKTGVTQWEKPQDTTEARSLTSSCPWRVKIVFALPDRPPAETVTLIATLRFTERENKRPPSGYVSVESCLPEGTLKLGQQSEIWRLSRDPNEEAPLIWFFGFSEDPLYEFILLTLDLEQPIALSESVSIPAGQLYFQVDYRAAAGSKEGVQLGEGTVTYTVASEQKADPFGLSTFTYNEPFECGSIRFLDTADTILSYRESNRAAIGRGINKLLGRDEADES